MSTDYQKQTNKKSAFHLPNKKCHIGFWTEFLFFGLNGQVYGRFLMSWEGDYMLLHGDRQLTLNKWAIVHKLYVISEQASETDVFYKRWSETTVCSLLKVTLKTGQRCWIQESVLGMWLERILGLTAVKSAQRVKRGNAWERLPLLSQYWVERNFFYLGFCKEIEWWQEVLRAGLSI